MPGSRNVNTGSSSRRESSRDEWIEWDDSDTLYYLRESMTLVAVQPAFEPPAIPVRFNVARSYRRWSTSPEQRRDSHVLVRAGLSGCGKADSERGARRCEGLVPGLATVELGKLTDDGQAEAGSAPGRRPAPEAVEQFGFEC